MKLYPHHRDLQLAAWTCLTENCMVYVHQMLRPLDKVNYEDQVLSPTSRKKIVGDDFTFYSTNNSWLTDFYVERAEMVRSHYGSVEGKLGRKI